MCAASHLAHPSELLVSARAALISVLAQSCMLGCPQAAPCHLECYTLCSTVKSMGVAFPISYEAQTVDSLCKCCTIEGAKHELHRHICAGPWMIYSCFLQDGQCRVCGDIPVDHRERLRCRARWRCCAVQRHVPAARPGLLRQPHPPVRHPLRQRKGPWVSGSDLDTLPHYTTGCRSQQHVLNFIEGHLPSFGTAMDSSLQEHAGTEAEQVTWESYPV